VSTEIQFPISLDTQLYVINWLFVYFTTPFHLRRLLSVERYINYELECSDRNLFLTKANYSGICLKGLRKAMINLRIAEAWTRDSRIRNRSSNHSIVMSGDWVGYELLGSLRHEHGALIPIATSRLITHSELWRMGEIVVVNLKVPSGYSHRRSEGNHENTRLNQVVNAYSRTWTR